MVDLSDYYDVNEAIKSDFMKRFPGFHKSRCEGITTLSSIILDVRSANLMELAAALPRDIGTKDHRYQYVSRVLSNPNIDCGQIMRSYAGEIFHHLAPKETIVLMLDQSLIKDENQLLMVSVRVGERVLPVLWRVQKTRGNIGFSTQKELLDTLLTWLPEEADVLFMADRFYGTQKLINYCQNAGWGYRIRLKSNLKLQHPEGDFTCGEIIEKYPQGIINAELYRSGVQTNIGVLHDENHPEPWIIAMDATPSREQVLEYGLRWGIEAMFSDFKSRGFGLSQSQIQKTDRLERLVLMMAIAMYWAVSTGAAAQEIASQSGEKRGSEKPSDHSAPSSNPACATCEGVSWDMKKFPSYGPFGCFEGW